MKWADMLFVPGIVIGVAGLLLMTASNPLYQYITEKTERKACA